jgi:hypothetical protein
MEMVEPEASWAVTGEPGALSPATKAAATWAGVELTGVPLHEGFVVFP